MLCWVLGHEEGRVAEPSAAPTAGHLHRGVPKQHGALGRDGEKSGDGEQVCKAWKVQDTLLQAPAQLWAACRRQRGHCEDTACPARCGMGSQVQLLLLLPHCHPAPPQHFQLLSAPGSAAARLEEARRQEGSKG